MKHNIKYNIIHIWCNSVNVHLRQYFLRDQFWHHQLDDQPESQELMI